MGDDEGDHVFIGVVGEADRQLPYVYAAAAPQGPEMLLCSAPLGFNGKQLARCW